MKVREKVRVRLKFRVRVRVWVRGTSIRGVTNFEFGEVRVRGHHKHPNSVFKTNYFTLKNPNPNFPEPELGFLAELEPELFHELSFFEVSNQYFFMQSFSDERFIIVGCMSKRKNEKKF